MINIYTDGAAKGNPGNGGYGVVLLYKDLRKELSEGYRLTTNNRMELLAVIRGLEALKVEGLPVTIYSDSKYVVDAVQKGWIWNWQKKGFKDKKNVDLWKKYIPLHMKYKPRFLWVKGHDGNRENERCDELAVAAASGPQLKADQGYEAEKTKACSDMGNSYFQFKQFRIEQDRCAMKVSTDAVVLGALVSGSEPDTILDIGTGTGVLALMMAQKFPNAQIQAIEIEQEAFLQASKNVSQSPFSTRLQLIHGDFQRFSARQEKTYDLIISNPPYFAHQLQSGKSAIDLARHERGLNFSELWEGVDKLLDEAGSFWLILPTREMSIFVNMGNELGFSPDWVTSLFHRQGVSAHRRIAGFTRGRKKAPKESSLTIRDKSGSYHPDFQHALKEFMLHF